LEDETMKARMKNAALILPDTMKAMQALHASSAGVGLPAKTVELVELRVSQINGCGVCVDGHARIMKKKGETDERLFGVAAWRDTPYFSDSERAALALAESLTRIADRPEGVPDDVWNEAARHFDERALAALLVAIANINVWNRLNVATRQVADPNARW
jgi:AhpD family alkylhydroperoxidase